MRGGGPIKKTCTVAEYKKFQKSEIKYNMHNLR